MKFTPHQLVRLIPLIVTVLFIILSGACASSASDLATSPGELTPAPAPDVATATASPTPSAVVPVEASPGSEVTTSAGEPTPLPATDPSTSATPGDDSDPFEVGAQVYASTCAGCHGQQGQGTPRASSLIGIAELQPDRATQISTVTYGSGGMRGRALLLTPEEIDAVVTFIRVSFVASEATDG